MTTRRQLLGAIGLLLSGLSGCARFGGGGEGEEGGENEDGGEEGGSGENGGGGGEGDEGGEDG